jgi:hypothetical protein
MVTQAKRINDCGFQEDFYQQGDQLKVVYPMVAYVVVRGLDRGQREGGIFKMSY